MRATATALLIGVTTVSVTVLVAAATVASLVTLGIHTWDQLLTVASAPVVLDIVSGVVGIGVVIGLLAGMFRYSHRRRDPSEQF
jgi:cell division protein FtsX